MRWEFVRLSGIHGISHEKHQVNVATMKYPPNRHVSAEALSVRPQHNSERERKRKKSEEKIAEHFHLSCFTQILIALYNAYLPQLRTQNRFGATKNVYAHLTMTTVTFVFCRCLFSLFGVVFFSSHSHFHLAFNG